MFRLIVSCLLVFSLLLLLPCTSLAQTQNELVIFTWADYFDPELQQKFEEQFQAKISFAYYSSDEARTELLAENNGYGYDLILTSGIDIGSYVKKGWLAPLQAKQLPNTKHLNQRWRSAFPYAEEYAVPFFWGTLGILYRTDLVTTPITSWKQLLQPNKKLQGKIAMMDDSRELLSIALKALGYSINSTDRDELKKAEELLMAQKPAVNTYLYISLEEDSPIVTGELIASLAYNGDALMVAEHHEQLEYVLPAEGSALWVDYFALSSKARNPELAHKFLNFLNGPENAAQMAEYVYSATPNLAAEKLLPEEFFNDPVIYPSAEALKSSEFSKALPPRVQRLRNNIGIRILR